MLYGMPYTTNVPPPAYCLYCRGTAPAHDRDALARPDREIDIDEHRPAVIADRGPLKLQRNAHGRDRIS